MDQIKTVFTIIQIYTSPTIKLHHENSVPQILHEDPKIMPHRHQIEHKLNKQ
jgi:hypothetical protein